LANSFEELEELSVVEIPSYMHGVDLWEPANVSLAEDDLHPKNVDRLLQGSIKAVKYGRHWDKWVNFAAMHSVAVMPPDMRALEIFVADLAELSGSAGVATTAAAAVAHFVMLEDFPLPFITPQFAKLLRGIRLGYGKAARPKQPLSKKDIKKFMDLARAGTLIEWRAAFPMALCFQQLLRGAECFDLNGENVVPTLTGYHMTVETSKNHPEGFEFDVSVKDRKYDIGRFMKDYITSTGIVLCDAGLFFACKLATYNGVLKAYPDVKVANFTMCKACKNLIADSGLDGCKRGAALEALKAGLSHSQIQDLGSWSSASMVARYSGGDAATRNKMVDSFST
jgi:hypothetical protein